MLMMPRCRWWNDGYNLDWSQVLHVQQAGATLYCTVRVTEYKKEMVLLYEPKTAQRAMSPARGHARFSTIYTYGAFGAIGKWLIHSAGLNVMQQAR